MYEIPAHNLAAPRPAPIPFPVCAGVHAASVGDAEEAAQTASRGGVCANSTQKDESRPTLEALLTRFEGFPDLSGKP